MKTAESVEYYQKLTKFQKDIVDALENLGFKHKRYFTWELIGWGMITVSKFSQLSDLLKYVHEQGKNQKRLEIKKHF